MRAINILEMRKTFMEEMNKRKLSSSVGHFAEKPGGKENLYSVTGAANVYAILGISLGTIEDRQKWANRIIKYKGKKGYFWQRSEKEHANPQVIAALNLLGHPIPSITCLAPLDVEKLSAWIATRNWSSIHKDLGGGATPILATGFGGIEWRDKFVELVTSRLNPDRPLEIWCRADDPSWRVISCIYHVLSAFDAASIPYPYPQMIFNRIINLGWELRILNIEQFAQMEIGLGSFNNYAINYPKNTIRRLALFGEFLNAGLGNGIVAERKF